MTDSSGMTPESVREEIDSTYSWLQLQIALLSATAQTFGVSELTGYTEEWARSMYRGLDAIRERVEWVASHVDPAEARKRRLAEEHYRRLVREGMERHPFDEAEPES